MRKAVILGAAGRDFHNFNVFFRDHPGYQVVAFTATQIPGIAGRRYPPELAGARYPQGIPIVPESELAGLVWTHGVDDVFFCYSDVAHEHVMHLASLALSCGASFALLGPRDTMLAARRPVVAVVASRTGAGKSTISRYVVRALRETGLRPIAVRHPMPYGVLHPGVERYASGADVAGSGLSVEAMEEYQQHVAEGSVVLAGVDYAAVLKAAEAQADVIVWDGGNNDMAFYRPTVNITVLDPTRPRQESSYFPGEVNVRAADVLVINKVNLAAPEAVEACERDASALNPAARVLRMASVEAIDRPDLIRGRRVLAIEDGPSLTHGGMPVAVAARAAKAWGATLVDPRPYARGSIAQAYRDHPHIGCVLPALGYGDAQLADLTATIAHVPCDAVLLGTPAPLEAFMSIPQPVARASFAARDVDGGALADAVLARLNALHARG